MNLGERLAALGARFTTGQKVAAGAVAVVLVAGGTVGGLVATSGSSHHAAAPTPLPSTTTTPTPTPTPTPKPKPKPPPVNPLTGVGPVPKGPVVAVKIDDVAAARPQVGIDKANIVYIEEVEGGLTRLVAVFGTQKPTVGPVRSVRASDPELLTQYGRIAFAASGGGGDSLPKLDASILKGDISDRGGPGFSRDGSREVPHNLMLNLAQIPSSFAAGAKPIGWTWAAHSSLAGAKPGTSLQTVVGGTGVRFQWDAGLKRYVRMIDGVTQHAADGAPVATPNVIVQFCEGYVNPADIDPAGNPGHYTKSVGRGKVAVFRNGKRIDGTWSRPTATRGTVLRDAKGKEIPLAPGGAWVVLASTGAPLTN